MKFVGSSLSLKKKKCRTSSVHYFFPPSSPFFQYIPQILNHQCKLFADAAKQSQFFALSSLIAWLSGRLRGRTIVIIASSAHSTHSEITDSTTQAKCWRLQNLPLELTKILSLDYSDLYVSDLGELYHVIFKETLKAQRCFLVRIPF